MESLGAEENEERPFWAKFLSSDYNQKEEKPLLDGVMQVLEGNATVDDLKHGRAGANQREDQLAIEFYKQQREQEDETPPMTPDRNTEDSVKLKKEWDKIKRLEMKIGQASKNESKMKQKMYDHKLKMEGMLNKAAKLEEEKNHTETVFGDQDKELEQIEKEMKEAEENEVKQKARMEEL